MNPAQLGAVDAHPLGQQQPPTRAALDVLGPAGIPSTLRTHMTLDLAVTGVTPISLDAGVVDG